MFGQDEYGCNRVVLLCLGLLNIILLIIAVVLGVNCAPAQQISYPNSHPAAVQLMNELEYLLSNHSDVMKAEQEARKELQRATKNHAKLKVKIDKQRTINDCYQRQVESLRKERKHLQSNVTALEGTCGKCPQGWTFFHSSCYFFSFMQIKNWMGSRDYCISHGADLVVIDHQDEQLYVSQSIKHFSSEVWIGLTDMASEGKWVWINNVTELEQRYWMPGEPDNSGHCGVSISSPSAPWQTRHDEDCRMQLFWICEMAPK
ncbi:CD209 antigen-like protein E [Dunckerocampus dactyliophorus]|uniref:CD209 antigen-like protein E n=1 Tax=Dunckerocampus dactyliophorus TaxID=161453 RepID=UPI0024063DB7|nr:CD209 antigen-like protein E [Dunckerocampus dactyliophorus]